MAVCAIIWRERPFVCQIGAIASMLPGAALDCLKRWHACDCKLVIARCDLRRLRESNGFAVAASGFPCEFLAGRFFNEASSPSSLVGVGSMRIWV